MTRLNLFILICISFIFVACSDSNDETVQNLTTESDKPAFCTQAGIDNVREWFGQNNVYCYNADDDYCMTYSGVGEENADLYNQECIDDGGTVYDSCAAVPNKTIIGGCHEIGADMSSSIRVFYAPSQESIEAENCMLDEFVWYSCGG